MSWYWRNGKKSGDGCQCDDVRDFGGEICLFIRFYGFCCRSPCPDSPLESVQQFFSTLRLTSGITQQPANLSDALAEVFDGRTKATGRRASFISLFSTDDVKNH